MASLGMTANADDCENGETSDWLYTVVADGWISVARDEMDDDGTAAPYGGTVVQ